MPFGILEIENDENDPVEKAQNTSGEAEGIFLDTEIQKSNEEDEEGFAHGMEQKPKISFELKHYRIDGFDLIAFKCEPYSGEEQEIDRHKGLR